MRTRVCNSIDDIGQAKLETLPTGLDFSFGLLRAMERSLWGDLLVRYVAVESDNGCTLLAFTPVYVGSNLNFNALLPKVVQKGYDTLVGGFGTAMATRVALAGGLISDRGGITMSADLDDRLGALRLVLEEIDRLARQHKVKLAMLKDIHQDVPAGERALMRGAGYAEGFSLPTIRINTAYKSFEEYLNKQLTKNARRHSRKQFHKADGVYSLRVVEEFECWIPRIYGLHRAVFLKAKYQFEELTPRFYVECARCQSPKAELVLCERNDGRLAGSLLIFHDGREQQNKRVGIDYGLADSGLIYNLLNYTGIQRAIDRGIKTLWLGQSSYQPKTRLGGELDDQYVFIKAHDPMLKPTLPLQRRWMTRYRAASVRAALEKGIAV